MDEIQKMENLLKEIHEFSAKAWADGGDERFGDIAGMIEVDLGFEPDINLMIRSLDLDEKTGENKKEV